MRPKPSNGSAGLLPPCLAAASCSSRSALALMTSPRDWLPAAGKYEPIVPRCCPAELERELAMGDPAREKGGTPLPPPPRPSGTCWCAMSVGLGIEIGKLSPPGPAPLAVILPLPGAMEVTGELSSDAGETARLLSALYGSKRSSPTASGSSETQHQCAMLGVHQSATHACACSSCGPQRTQSLASMAGPASAIRQRSRSRQR